MKVTYQTCCGVDIHKSFLVATIVKTTGGVEPSYRKKRFSTFNNSILELKQWLLDNDCRDIYMKSTGKCWVPIFNLLEGDINVIITNLKWIKAMKGNKNDTRNSKWIRDLFRLGLIRGSYVPCKEIRILREYTRYRCRSVSCRSSEKNRYQNVLTVCNVALNSVVSDIFGKSPTSTIDYPLERSDTSINHGEVISELLRSLRSREDAAIESVERCQATDAQEYRIRLVRAYMDYITAEIGTDMSQFSSSKCLCYWANLTPENNESAGKEKSIRITRAGVYLRPVLVQYAHAAMESDKSPYYKKKYDSLVKHHGKKRAIIAIARMILTAIYQMMSTGEQWNPSNLCKVDVPVALVEERKAEAIK